MRLPECFKGQKESWAWNAGWEQGHACDFSKISTLTPANVVQLPEGFLAWRHGLLAGASDAVVKSATPLDPDSAGQRAFRELFKVP
jgi:hypothetical protein